MSKRKKLPLTFQPRTIMRPGEFRDLEAASEKISSEESCSAKKLEQLEDKIADTAKQLTFNAPQDEVLSQLADMQQAIEDALHINGIAVSELEKVKQDRLHALGSYVNGIFVRTIYVDPAKNPELYDTLVQNPARYPTQLD